MRLQRDLQAAGPMGARGPPSRDIEFVESGSAGTIVIAEDDEVTSAFLADNLRADGFHAATAAGPDEAIRAIEARQPDLLLLDLGLGGADGLDLLDRVRGADGLATRVDPEVPVIVVTGRSSEADRVRGLARGADDYLVKPFSYSELLARMRAVLRRARGRRGLGVLRVGELSIDPASRAVALGGRPVSVTAKEFALLHALARDPTRVHTKAELLRDVWGFRSEGATRTVDAHACRLRRKLSRGAREYVVNTRGVGYRLTAEA